MTTRKEKELIYCQHQAQIQEILEEYSEDMTAASGAITAYLCMQIGQVIRLERSRNQQKNCKSSGEEHYNGRQNRDIFQT